jgi:hypothetical protein
MYNFQKDFFRPTLFEISQSIGVRPEIPLFERSDRRPASFGIS